MKHSSLSVVVTTYNRASLLALCLERLLGQSVDQADEILVVDDGSTDATADMLDEWVLKHPRLRVVRQSNAGRAVARNTGYREARGELLCYVDSDVLVVPHFVAAHRRAHQRAGRRRVFAQGHTRNVPTVEGIDWAHVPRLDPSRAFFDTKNVSVPRQALESVGGFDTGFTEYGWEDLELGVRLKQSGYGIIRVPPAFGFHIQPAFSVDSLDRLRRLEEERGRMAARFLVRHPTLDVRLMTQATPLHRALNHLVTMGGRIDEYRAAPFLEWLVLRGQVELAAQLAQLVLNQYNLRELERSLNDMSRLGDAG
jgi:glycosyltransferase involved in cell wall biosynthesis